MDLVLEAHRLAVGRLAATLQLVLNQRQRVIDYRICGLAAVPPRCPRCGASILTWEAEGLVNYPGGRDAPGYGRGHGIIESGPATTRWLMWQCPNYDDPGWDEGDGLPPHTFGPVPMA